MILKMIGVYLTLSPDDSKPSDWNVKFVKKRATLEDLHGGVLCCIVNDSLDFGIR